MRRPIAVVIDVALPMLLSALLVVAAAPQELAAGPSENSMSMGMALEPPHLDPTAGAAAAIDEVVYANVFEGLTRIDRDGRVQPALARDWQVSDDGLSWTFELAQDVIFHDGSVFDATDVVFSFERAMAEDSVNAQKGLFDGIRTVEAVSPHEVRIELERPVGDLLVNLAWGDAVIVDPATAESNRTRPVGTGPFAFARRVEGDRVVLERFADYWGEPVALTGATFKFIPDPAAAAAALLAGDVDAFANFPAPESVARFEADPRFEVAVGLTEGETILAINNARPPLDDLRVRRALAHAVDREALINGAMFGYGAAIGSHFPPNDPAYVDLTGYYPHDPRAARALLEEANARDLTLAIALPPPSYARRSGEIIQAQLQDVGLDVELVPIEWAQWLERVFANRDYDLTIVAHTEPMDIGIYARDDYYFGYDDPAFDAVMEELARTSERDARARLLRKAQEIITKDSVNVFLFQLPKLGIWDERLEGLWQDSPVQANDLTEVRWAGS